MYDENVQRVCAVLLLALFTFPPIVPAIRVASETKLPACCRRDGKHHCGMVSTASQEQTSGAAIREKCPYYPGASAVPASLNSILLNPSQLYFAAVVKHPALQRQTEALQRISFNRSRQKRGPPAFVS